MWDIIALQRGPSREEKAHLMQFAYVDESGAPSPAGGGRYFVVAALVSSMPRAIELHVRRARRSLHRRTSSSELKAAQSDPTVIRRLLEAIGEESCEIYAIIVDKHGLKEQEAETVYQMAVAQTIAHVAERHPFLHVCVDKRYTKLTQRLALEQRIREALAHLADQVIIIEQADSAAVPGLQAADFVAWGIRSKHLGEGEWAELIQDRIVVEELIRGKKLAALPGGR
jgi:hypothetical protein